jgi:integrase
MENQRETDFNGLIVGEPGEYFTDYLRGLDPETAQQYKYHFLRFLKWVELDTKELYYTHLENLKSDIPLKRMWVGRQVRKYQEYMRDELGYSVKDEQGNIAGASGSVIIVRKVVLGFFRCLGVSDIALNGRIETVIGEIPIITHDQLRTLLEATGNLRNRAIILTAKDSGLRESDLIRIKVSHVKEALDNPDLEFITFEILPWKNRKKSKIRANPCLGPESLEAIRRWMKYRKKKEIPTSDELPLFCTLKNKKGSTTKRGTVKPSTKAGDWLKDGTPGTMFYYLVRKVSLENTGISIHSCRKFLQTNLEWSQVTPNWINKITGRKGRGTSGIYSKPNPVQLIEAYRKGYSNLSLNGDASKAEIQEIQQQNIELLGRLAQLENLVHQRDKAYNQIDPTQTPTTAQELEKARRLVNKLLKAQEHLDKKVAQLTEH